MSNINVIVPLPAGDPGIAKMEVDEGSFLPYESEEAVTDLHRSEETMRVLSFIAMMDNGGRRLKTERRKRTIPLDFPDRRSGKDRRAAPDRREMQSENSKRAAERRKSLISSPSEL